MKKNYLFYEINILILVFFILTLADPFDAFSKPGHATNTNYCIECHKDLELELSNAVKQWEASIHREVDVGCADCHGGNPKSLENAMDRNAGFIGVPQKVQVPALCAKCHSDPNRMKQFNLRTDQLAEYKTSVHGKRLFEKGDTKVAVCTDCHGAHNIKKKTDPGSSVFHTNVPETCGKCHARPEYMKPYGIPTDQLSKYKESYHGKILYGEISGKNPSLVPNCADCHGIHGAIPPGIGEISNVCGNCHFVVAKFFKESPHFLALQENGVPRCIDCHSNHKILYPNPEMFSGSDEGHCGSCHDDASPQLELAKQFLTILDDMNKKAESTESGVNAILDTGKNIDDIIIDLSQVKNVVVKSKALTHTLSLQKIKELAGNVDETTNSINKRVNNILSEVKERKRFMFVSLILLGTIIITLYLKVLRKG